MSMTTKMVMIGGMKTMFNIICFCFIGGMLIGFGSWDNANKWRIIPVLIGTVIVIACWYSHGVASVVCGG